MSTQLERWFWVGARPKSFQRSPAALWQCTFQIGMFKNTSMAKSWIALRAGWKLEDVQAALNVVISMLSTMGIFVFARFCWHETAARVDRSQNVRLSSLLSLSTPGEV